MSKFCMFLLFLTPSILLLVQTATSAESPEKNDNPYILPDFDTNQVAQLKEGKTEWDECWNKLETYRVCLTRTHTGEEYLEWTSKYAPFIVQMKKEKNGNVHQTWQFENFGINLYRGVDGNLNQTWGLPETAWKYSKSADGKISEKWLGPEDVEGVRHHKSIIDSWCAVNDFYLGKENCAIY